MALENAVIVSAVRTPIGSLKGALSSVKGHELGSVVIREALQRAAVKGEEVTEVIMGQVLTAGGGANPARQASVNAGLPSKVTASGVNMLCGSGLKAVAMAAQAVRLGDAQIVVAGGMDSMSQAPHCVHMRANLKFGEMVMEDTMLKDALVSPVDGTPLGATVDKAARQWSLSRQEQDQYALNSQQKYQRAYIAGHFDKEIVPVPVVSPKTGVVTEVTKDEFPRPDSTMEGLQKLLPAFVKDGSGTVTAGNSSGHNDGAAAVVVMTEGEALKRRLQPMARIVSWAQSGEVTDCSGSPKAIPAVQEAMQKAGWTVQEVDLFELGEAFAVKGMSFIKDIGCDPGKVNVSGGAIALGHPLGAAGIRILVTLLHSMARIPGAKKGVAAVGVGGGMSIAVCVQA